MRWLRSLSSSALRDGSGSLLLSNRGNSTASRIYTTPVPKAWMNRPSTNSALMAQAFSQGLGQVGAMVVLVAAVLFGVSTLITWALYGEQCAVYLWGPSARRRYRVLYCIAILGGALGEARVIWAWGDFFNGVMAVPNLIALLALGGELAGMLKKRRAST